MSGGDSSVDDLHAWMADDEGHHLEFKEAKRSFEFEDLVKYCAALANEGGGRIVLGVSDRKPRRVVGTQAFPKPRQTEQSLIERIKLKVRADEIAHDDGRVLVFDVPKRHRGVPVQYKGAYWMRAGESLAAMTTDEVRRIIEEAVTDFSAETTAAASISDLEPAAIEEFRARWLRKSGNSALAGQRVEQLLEDAELFVDGQMTIAGLVLMGSRAGLARANLAQAEVVFEYRATEAAIPAQQRVEFREGLLLFHDRLWELIDRRNDRQSYQDGFFRYDIPTFDERTVREAVLNAVAHRDYRSPGSVFVRQFHRSVEIVSPGGFPEGISPANILDRQLPRNRRLAEALARCGLVERSGQGINVMFTEAIRAGKPLPDFSGSDSHQVSVVIRGEIESPAFLRFLERLGKERTESFTAHDFLVLDLVRRDAVIPESLHGRTARLVDAGALEQIGRGRGARYLLSRSLYAEMGQAGAYTRRRGLDWETNKELLVSHLRRAGAQGSPISELSEVLPQLTRRQVRFLLEELRREARIGLQGVKRSARWVIRPLDTGPRG